MGKRAHDVALRIARGLEGELKGMRREHVVKLQAIYKQLIAELGRDLKGKSGFKAAKTAAYLARARVIGKLLAARLAGRVNKELEAIGKEAATIGRSNLGRQLEAWIVEYPTIVEGFPRLAAVGDVADKGLVERYNVRSGRYSKGALATIRTVMADGAAKGEPMQVTWKRLADALGLPEYRAERLVRTEAKYAASRRQLLDLKKYGDPSQWRKQLWATLDSRTGDDSKFVNRQVREVSDNFDDNQGRSYPHPPNRPNDREVMLFVPK